MMTTILNYLISMNLSVICLCKDVGVLFSQVAMPFPTVPAYRQHTVLRDLSLDVWSSVKAQSILESL